MSFDPFESRFEAALERHLSQNTAAKVDISGCNSSLALGMLLAQSTSPLLNANPHLVVVADTDDLDAWLKNLRFWNPSVRAQVLKPFDVSPYSGLYPHLRVVSSRVGFLHRAARAQPGEIFIATIEALLQKTLPAAALKENLIELRVGAEIPGNFIHKLGLLGYQSAPVVEDCGSFSARGGIIDVFSPSEAFPVRIELFGDQIDSMRLFDPLTQRSIVDTNGEAKQIQTSFILPAREILLTDDSRERAANLFRRSLEERGISTHQAHEVMHAVVHGHYFAGVDFLLPYFYQDPPQCLAHFNRPINLWLLDSLEIERASDKFVANLKKERAESLSLPICPEINEIYLNVTQLSPPPHSRTFALSRLEMLKPEGEAEGLANPESHFRYDAKPLRIAPITPDRDQAQSAMESLTRLRRDDKQIVFISTHTEAQAQRLVVLLERNHFSAELITESCEWQAYIDQQGEDPNHLHIISRGTTESVRLPEEGVVLLREEDFFGKKVHRREYGTSGSLAARTQSFSDLNMNDLVVHVLHGVGRYEGLKVMPIQGLEAEFVQIRYRDDDKLYLPIYRIGQIQKYANHSSGVHRELDKLGGSSWGKATVKVKNSLRDMASELLQLYAKRAQISRPPFATPNEQFCAFEERFAYDETEDQLKAVSDVTRDLLREQPMDRLICGDVGFGKTEIAMRAAFLAVHGGKQVAVLAPTTVLTFQHLETFRRRFKDFPANIHALNRFVERPEQRKILEDLAQSRVDIIIGTHRLLSKDVQIPNLGLLIVDEEQKFGVAHKEKIRKLKLSVDTLAMSATPIPRTLNMSLMGLRDLSIINTPPSDRLPTRTFVTKFDEEAIRKAVLAEIQRGGQIFFIHNRVQSIYQRLADLRQFLPEVRMVVAHGQMEEHELERAMMAFFNHEIDMLVCTTIVESGMDIPKANTMFIDDAHAFGLSQLYQLRGRVGRSKERAYCYLLIPSRRVIDPVAQERLRIIQENTALGSGIRIAQYDLEIRGGGNLLGEEQAGNINTVGYELYLSLLEDAFKEVKGEEIKEEIDPEINVRIPALIPSHYMPDIRMRLSYYKSLSEISSVDDIDRIEDELSDQYGKPPPEVLNLMGLMLVRKGCKDLGVRDLSAGLKSISLAFTPSTPLPPQKVVALASQDNKKFSLTPDSRLIIRMNNINWPNILEELNQLLRLAN